MILKELKDKYGFVMTANQVAEVLHMHPSHVRSLCKSGELPATRIGSRYLVSTENLAHIIESGRR